MQSSNRRSWFLPQAHTLRWVLTLLAALVLAACDSGDGAVRVPVLTQSGGSTTVTVASGTTTVTGIVHTVESNSAFRIGSLQIIRPPEVDVPEAIVALSYVRVTGSVRDRVLTASEIIVLGDGRSYRLDGQIDAIDPSRRTVHLLGNEFFWRTETSGTPANLVVGDWIRVEAHGNRFVRSIARWSAASASVIEGEWIRDMSPPIGFTLESAFDVIVQLTPSATLAVSYLAGDGDCYGGGRLSNDEFFRRMSEPRPTGYTLVHAEGRFESGLLIADKVWFCHA